MQKNGQLQSMRMILFQRAIETRHTIHQFQNILYQSEEDILVMRLQEYVHFKTMYSYGRMLI